MEFSLILLQGPPEKPGIFIQSTKAGRLAREIGLRPGDQILQCNGIDFDGLDFGEAVYHLKVSLGGTVYHRKVNLSEAVDHLKASFGGAVYHIKINLSEAVYHFDKESFVKAAVYL